LDDGAARNTYTGLHAPVNHNPILSEAKQGDGQEIALYSLGPKGKKISQGEDYLY
jgi:hypothetical protein